MRIPFRLATLTAILAIISVAPAADPPPLVKPINPRGGVRARIPLMEDDKHVMQFKARIPDPKGSQGETIDVSVMLGTLSHTPRVSTKTWQSWGYEIPPNRTGFIDLMIPASQLAPRVAKGRDVEVLFTRVQVEILELAGGAEKISGCDIFLDLDDIVAGNDRLLAPRLHFADRFLEMTVPRTAYKRLRTDDIKLSEPIVTADEELVPTVAPMVTTGKGRANPIFAYASVNGQTVYMTEDGRQHRVRAGVSSTTRTASPGISMTVHTARGCGVEFQAPEDREWSTVKGTAKEIRIGVLAGTGRQVQKDFVLKDVPVIVNHQDSYGFVYFGPRFVEEYFKDGIYGCEPDGVWRLHGRVKEDLLLDIKTRTVPKKP